MKLGNIFQHHELGRIHYNIMTKEIHNKGQFTLCRKTVGAFTLAQKRNRKRTCPITAAIFTATFRYSKNVVVQIG